MQIHPVVVYPIFLHKFGLIVIGEAWCLILFRNIEVMGLRVQRVVFALGVMALALLSGLALAQQKAGPDFDTLLHHAFELHQQARYNESLPLFRQAFRLRPQDYFVNLLLGIDLLRSGKPSDAVPFLRTAARLRPKEEFPREYLGESYAHLGRFHEAVKSFADAMQVAPASEQAITAFVDFSLERIREISMQLRATREGLAAEYRIEALAHPLDDPSRARILEKSAELDPAAPGIWSELALAHVVLGQFNEAEQDLQSAAAANPNDLIALEAKALQAAKHGTWPDAARYLNVALRRSPAMMQKIARDWPAALRPQDEGAKIIGPASILFACLKVSREACDSSAGKKIALEPGPGVSPPVLFREQRWELLAHLPQPSALDHEGWFSRGVAFAETGDCASALPALERARGSARHDAQTMYSLSICYAKSAGEAASHFQNKDNEMVHVMRGDMLLRLRAESGAALAEYELALAQRPRDPAILERVAEAQFAAGQNDAARESAQAALSIDPQRISAKRTLAKLLMQDRDYAAALPYLHELVSHGPADPSVRVELATACAQTGAYNDAVQNLAPMLEKGYPDEKGRLHYVLGTALRKLGRNQEADAAFAAARQLSEQFQHGSLQDRK